MPVSPGLCVPGPVGGSVGLQAWLWLRHRGLPERAIQHVHLWVHRHLCWSFPWGFAFHSRAWPQPTYSLVPKIDL